MSSETTFVWVVGCPRSGTTFLTDLIGQNCDRVYNEPGKDPTLARGLVDQWQFPPAENICFKWCENYKVADQILSRFPKSFFVHIMRERNNNVFSMAFPKETAFPPRQFPDLGEEADDRIVNAAKKWVNYNRGCLDLRSRLGERYIPVFYEHLPDYYTDIEARTGLSLRIRPEFRNQNLDKSEISGLSDYWSQIEEAEQLITEIGKLRIAERRRLDQNYVEKPDPGSHYEGRVVGPGLSRNESQSASPGRYAQRSDLPPADASEDYFPPESVRFNSAYGGLWVDASNAPEVIDGKQKLGWITADEAERLRFLHENGFVVLPRAVSDQQVNDVREDFDKAWAGELGQCKISYFDQGHKNTVNAVGGLAEKPEAKLLDFHMASASARKAIFSQTVNRFLALIFERPAIAFQSLGFEYGSQQTIHSDIAFVRVDSPREFVASWIALEDIEAGSGELIYYPGSHLLPDFILNNGSVWSNTMMSNYGKTISEGAESAGLSKERFLAKKGDVLIWTAGLYHGGSSITKPGATRRSLVTHYCPEGRLPFFMMPSSPFARKNPREVHRAENGGLVCGKYTEGAPSA